MSYLLERDALNGKEGRVFCTINGRQIEMFGTKKIQLDYSLEESDFKVVGTRLVQKKTTGITLTGTMDIYYGTTEFSDLIQNYIETGELPYFTMMVENDDPSSSLGTRTIALYNVKLQSGVLAMLDADSDFLVESVGFSFTGFKKIRDFNPPAQLG
jgi:hypothetical protein